MFIFTIHLDYHEFYLLKIQTISRSWFFKRQPALASFRLRLEQPYQVHTLYHLWADRGWVRGWVVNIFFWKVFSFIEEKKYNSKNTTKQLIVSDPSVISIFYCLSQRRMWNGWDLGYRRQEESPHETVQACTKLREKPEPHFSRVFRNDVYDVLKISKWWWAVEGNQLILFPASIVICFKLVPLYFNYYINSGILVSLKKWYRLIV